jgi:hypothetical protein
MIGSDTPAITAAALRSLAAERDALRAEVERLGAACGNYFRQISLMQLRHSRHLPSLETRIARQRRVLAKLYAKRHDRKAERDHLEKTAMQAAQCHGRETLRADGLQAENARLLKILAHIGEDDLESLSDAIAMALCRADGNDPYAVVSIKEEGKEPTFHLPYWQHYRSKADQIARAALGETQ